MSADIAKIAGGYAMGYVGKSPWHTNANVIDPSLQYSIDGFIKAAGLDWEVGIGKAFDSDGTDVSNLSKLIYRMEGDKRVNLAAVGPRFRPLQNREAFDFFKPFLDTQQAALDTAGALDNGRRIWVLARLKLANAEVCKGDEIAKYVLLSNSHDGSLSIRVGFTPIRIVCKNTMAMAHNTDASKLIRIRHNDGAVKSLEAVRETMNLANQEFEASVEQYRFLQSKEINDADLRKYVKVVVGIPENDEEMTTRNKNLLTEIIANMDRRVEMHREMKELVSNAIQANDEFNKNLLEQVIAETTSKYKPTVWESYNAINGHLNHKVGRTAETRLNSLWFGKNAQVNQFAFQTAMELANKL